MGAAAKPPPSVVLRSRDIWKPRRAHFVLFVAIAIAIQLLTTINAAAAGPKRVLLVHSFGRAAPIPPLSLAFESELIANLGEPVDLDEVSVDIARYADPEMQEAVAEYLEKHRAKWRPDLVVPMAAPAAMFVANYRDRLFPETPVLYVGSDPRNIPAGALEKNATAVGQALDIPGVFEDILRVRPATKNIVIIVGATPLERRWQQAFQKAAEPLARRINFSYYNDLSFEQMQERVAKLPPDSYIFYFILVRDAAGVTFIADDALRRLSTVANAPINALFVHQLGTGVVGGRLYQMELVGKESADVAIRILHGEAASSFPPKVIERGPPRYDWRALQRWKISEKLLPPGSTILFREPTVWDRYRTWLIAGFSICLLQALLISGLVANLAKRRLAERSLRRAEEETRHHREQVHLLGRVSLLGEMAASLAHELTQPLSAIVTNANAGMRFMEGGQGDRATLHEILADVVADGHRAHEIIQNVRNTIKKGDSTRQRIDLNELVTKVAHIVRPDAVGHSCEIETLLAEDLPTVEGDPVQIQQILVNLVSNAFDAMRQIPPDQRKVEIRTAGNGDGEVRLSVRDHGTGIHAEVHEHLFEEFFTTKEHGLGMGLAIVRSIVEAHGGKIDVENAADGGALFYFTLPATHPIEDGGST